jgi:hypothetical protein
MVEIAVSRVPDEQPVGEVSISPRPLNTIVTEIEIISSEAAKENAIGRGELTA